MVPKEVIETKTSWKEKALDASFKNGPLFIILLVAMWGLHNIIMLLGARYLDQHDREVKAMETLAEKASDFMRVWNPGGR